MWVRISGRRRGAGGLGRMVRAYSLDWVAGQYPLYFLSRKAERRNRRGVEEEVYDLHGFLSLETQLWSRLSFLSSSLPVCLLVLSFHVILIEMEV